jgi:hypothetical protein
MISFTQKKLLDKINNLENKISNLERDSSEYLKILKELNNLRERYENSIRREEIIREGERIVPTNPMI